MKNHADLGGTLTKANQDRDNLPVEFDHETCHRRNNGEYLFGWLDESQRVHTRFKSCNRRHFQFMTFGAHIVS
ncbi:MAG: hypothetical protein AAFV43_09560 [Planctomycetota bacterium]